jgi:putative thioredoxin
MEQDDMSEAQQAAIPQAGKPGGALVRDVTTASFRTDVIAESMNRPVLVDFWAPWCGPCKQLTPVLEKAVQSAGGKVVLAKMNIDDHPDIAGRLGIQSIPAVIAFQRGQPVDGFMGALPESQVKAFIEKLIGPVVDETAELLIRAETALVGGDAAGAAELFAAALQTAPEEAKAIGGLARALLELGETQEARGVLDAAPARLAADPAIAAARAALDLAEQAAGLGDLQDLAGRVASNAEDHEARFDLAVALASLGKRDEAAGALLEIIRRDRKWGEEKARKQLLQFFDAWGPMDAATIQARRRLSSLLFS